jgi:hypothetical protein
MALGKRVAVKQVAEFSIVAMRSPECKKEPASGGNRFYDRRSLECGGTPLLLLAIIASQVGWLAIHPAETSPVSVRNTAWQPLVKTGG